MPWVWTNPLLCLSHGLRLSFTSTAALMSFHLRPSSFNLFVSLLRSCAQWQGSALLYQGQRGNAASVWPTTRRGGWVDTSRVPGGAPYRKPLWGLSPAHCRHPPTALMWHWRTEWTVCVYATWLREHGSDEHREHVTTKQEKNLKLFFVLFCWM